MTTQTQPTTELNAPYNQARVRLNGAGVVFSDLGPAMGRTTAYMHRLLANRPEFQGFVERRTVGNREGCYVLSLTGVEFLIGIMRDSKGWEKPGYVDSMSSFLEWAERVLIPKLRARQGQAESIPCVVRITAEGQTDLRLDMADLGRLQIELHRPGMPKILINGRSLLHLQAN